MSRLIISFKMQDDFSTPWPIGIDDDNFVTSGLGPDDGAKWIGFAPKGEEKFLALPEDFPTLDFENQDIVPVFSKDGSFFNWDVVIRSIGAVA